MLDRVDACHVMLCHATRLGKGEGIKRYKREIRIKETDQIKGQCTSKEVKLHQKVGLGRYRVHDKCKSPKRTKQSRDIIELGGGKDERQGT